MNHHKDAIGLVHTNNAVCKHVRYTNHANGWRAAKFGCNSNVESLRLAVESALIRKIPNFNNVQRPLGVDALSSDITLKLKPDIMSGVLN